MTTRIERLSKAEHDMIQQVHPEVGEESVKDVAAAVAGNSSHSKSR
jgi:hypothetical protein